MKIFPVFSSLLLALTTAFAASKSPLEYERQFANWMEQHHISFDDALEYATRLKNFISNDLFIAEHNAQLGASFTMGHNEFSHLTFDEFQAMKKGFSMPPGYLEARLERAQAQEFVNTTTTDVPESIDWVAKGGVTPVKNQGQCGSCWAFSTTGAVEGAVFVSSGKLLSLSEQELVDCDENGDHGCSGGLMDNAFQWIEEKGGICSEEEYSYHASSGVCRICKAVAKVSGYQDVQPNSEEALKAAVAQQPVSVAIEADQRAFQFYKSGVFDLECGTQLDHGVLVVGYGADEANGKKYWKIKNSWGPTWGESGFIRLVRGANGPSGQCGVAMAPSYPFATVAVMNETTTTVDVKELDLDLAMHGVDVVDLNEEPVDMVEQEEPMLVVEEIIMMLEPTPEEVVELLPLEQAQQEGVYEYLPEGF